MKSLDRAPVLYVWHTPLTTCRGATALGRALKGRPKLLGKTPFVHSDDYYREVINHAIYGRNFYILVALLRFLLTMACKYF